MGINVEIIDYYLEIPDSWIQRGVKDISPYLVHDPWLGWEVEYDTLQLEDTQFKWSNQFIVELRELAHAGVGGHVTVMSNTAGIEFEKFMLEEGKLKYQVGTIAFTEMDMPEWYLEE